MTHSKYNWGEFNYRIISQKSAGVMGTNKKWWSIQGWATLGSCYQPYSWKGKVTVKAEPWERGCLAGAMVLSRGTQQLPNQNVAGDKEPILFPPALQSPDGGSHWQIQLAVSRICFQGYRTCWGVGGRRKNIFGGSNKEYTASHCINQGSMGTNDNP